jgi:YesN/AraC family two-component response regulator
MQNELAYLNSHLTLDDVVEHCQLGRTYVSLTFSRRFGSFSNYVNGLRLSHFDQYVADHPEETKEAAARASGYSSYNSYYRAKQKMEHESLRQ